MQKHFHRLSLSKGLGIRSAPMRVMSGLIRLAQGLDGYKQAPLKALCPLRKSKKL
jgi:hypothetical protein